MRYFIDTEFHEDGETIDLISIALIAEDGREFYAISNEFDQERANRNPFLVEKVLPNLYKVNLANKMPLPEPCSRVRIAYDILQFVGFAPVFWADYASYDWLAFCQLPFSKVTGSSEIPGTMIGLPASYPMFCRDIQQLKSMLLVPDFPPGLHTGVEHNALDDARECRNRYEYLAQVWRSFSPFYRP